MRGTILGFDPTTNTGAISGFDGNRYDFVRLEWRAEGAPAAGLEVDFQIAEGKASSIYPVQQPVELKPFSWGDFLFSYKGRTPRSYYWLRFQLVYFILAVIVGIIDGVSGSQGALSVLLVLAMFWPSLVVNIKRCHDRDHSGWWLLIGLIPVFGSLWLLIELGFLRGTIGVNRFGADPVVV